MSEFSGDISAITLDFSVIINLWGRIQTSLTPLFFEDERRSWRKDQVLCEGTRLSRTEVYGLFKDAQAWDIRDRVIDTGLSRLGRWLEDYTKKSICVKCQANICHYVFLPMYEYVVKIIPRLLSGPLKIVPRSLSRR
jgi:hypothetical protein